MFQNIDINLIDIPKHIPKFIEIKKSKIHGLGAYAKKDIPRGTFLGNYMGKINKEVITGPYIFHSIRNEEIISIDATKKTQSNWTRYMNCSNQHQTENVTCFYLTNKEDYIKNNKKVNLEGYIVFYSNRDIQKGEELLYYYGDNYAEMLNIDYKLKN